MAALQVAHGASGDEELNPRFRTNYQTLIRGYGISKGLRKEIVGTEADKPPT